VLTVAPMRTAGGSTIFGSKDKASIWRDPYVYNSGIPILSLSARPSAASS